jgi:hypothetical protein
MQVSNQGLPLRVRSKSHPFLQARLKAPMGVVVCERICGTDRTSKTFTFTVLQIST